MTGVFTCDLCGGTEEKGAKWDELTDSLCEECVDALCNPIFTEIVMEQIRRAQLWGGPDHDDCLTECEWQSLIEAHMEGLVDCMGAPSEDHRQGLVRIAAAAIAAIESHDRREVAK